MWGPFRARSHDDCHFSRHPRTPAGAGQARPDAAVRRRPPAAGRGDGRRDPGAADPGRPRPLRQPGLRRLGPGPVRGLGLPQRNPAVLRQRPPRRRLRLADQHLGLRERPHHCPRLRGRPAGRCGDLHPQHHRFAEPAGRLPARRRRRAHRRGALPRHRAPRQPPAVAGRAAPQRHRRPHPRRHAGAAPRANSPTAASACSPSPAPPTSPARSCRSGPWPPWPTNTAPGSSSTPPSWPRTGGSTSPRTTSTTSPSPGTSSTPPSAPACWWAVPTGSTPAHRTWPAAEPCRTPGSTRVSWTTGPARHEGGSPNVLGAATLARATQVIADLDVDQWHAHENAIRSFLVEGLARIDGVTVHQIFSDSASFDAPAGKGPGNGAGTGTIGVVNFSVEGYDAGPGGGVPVGRTRHRAARRPLLRAPPAPAARAALRLAAGKLRPGFPAGGRPAAARRHSRSCAGPASAGTTWWTRDAGCRPTTPAATRTGRPTRPAQPARPPAPWTDSRRDDAASRRLPRAVNSKGTHPDLPKEIARGTRWPQTASGTAPGARAELPGRRGTLRTRPPGLPRRFGRLADSRRGQGRRGPRRRNRQVHGAAGRARPAHGRRGPLRRHAGAAAQDAPGRHRRRGHRGAHGAARRGLRPRHRRPGVALVRSASWPARRSPGSFAPTVSWGWSGTSWTPPFPGCTGSRASCTPATSTSRTSRRRVGPEFAGLESHLTRWEDPVRTADIMELTKSRSYYLAAGEATRAKVLGNLDWYLHEHLGHDPRRGAPAPLPDTELAGRPGLTPPAPPDGRLGL